MCIIQSIKMFSYKICSIFHESSAFLGNIIKKKFLGRQKIL